MYFFSTQSIIPQSKDRAFWFVYVGGHGPVLRVCAYVSVCAPKKLLRNNLWLLALDLINLGCSLSIVQLFRFCGPSSTTSCQTTCGAKDTRMDPGSTMSQWTEHSLTPSSRTTCRVTQVSPFVCWVMVFLLHYFLVVVVAQAYKNLFFKPTI